MFYFSAGGLYVNFTELFSLQEGLYYTRVQPGKTDDSTIISGSWQKSYFTESKEEIEKIVKYVSKKTIIKVMFDLMVFSTGHTIYASCKPHFFLLLRY